MVMPARPRILVNGYSGLGSLGVVDGQRTQGVVRYRLLLDPRRRMVVLQRAVSLPVHMGDQQFEAPTTGVAAEAVLLHLSHIGDPQPLVGVHGVQYGREDGRSLQGPRTVGL